MKEYIRDKRSPKPSSNLASKVMSSIKGKNTRPELIIRKLLYANGLTGYRLHWNVHGRPDIVYVSKRLAIFIHGCYWHKCPKCQLPLPKSNASFWKAKLDKNVDRDSQKIKALEDTGWRVFVFWECDIKSSPMLLIRQVRETLMEVEI